MWGWWWIFPVIGFIFMLMVMFSACSGFFRKRGSSGGMGKTDTMEDLKREIGKLKNTSPQLNKPEWQK